MRQPPIRGRTSSLSYLVAPLISIHVIALQIHIDALMSLSVLSVSHSIALKVRG